MQQPRASAAHPTQAPVRLASPRDVEVERLRSLVLERVARGAPLQQILDGLIAFVEGSVPDTIGTILRLEGDRVYHAASSKTMPVEFATAIEGAQIGPEEGSCGTAAYWNRTVIVSDIENDPLWKNYRALALPLGLRSCWSTPIVSGDRVIGTIAFYSHTVREPSQEDLRYLHAAGNVASIAMAGHEARAALERIALSDPLTGLPNRNAFERELATALIYAAASTTRVAVGVLGLNRFKTINDTLGHETGDLVLREIAIRLHAAAGKACAFSRLGSDEFAFFVRDVRERGEAESCALTLEAALDSSLVPNGEEIYIHATTGFSVYPDDAIDSSRLISQAYVAMREAKRANALVGFHSGRAEHDGRRRLGIETHLRRALERREFELHYQPIILLGAGEVTGVEALLRWTNPKLGRVAPDEFIPLAEEMGLITVLGQWVLQEACRFGKRWLELGGSGEISVNVSARQFEDGSLARTVAEALEDAGLSATKLTLEITESAILRSPEVVFATIEALRKRGVRCYIDDFGTGYSSLARLAQFRIDGLKIDRSFLRDLGKPVDAGADALLVRAMVSLGKAMRLAIVAEGVETEAQRAFLMAAGCDLAQGFLFAKAMPEDDLLARTLSPGAEGPATFWGGPAL